LDERCAETQTRWSALLGLEVRRAETHTPLFTPTVCVVRLSPVSPCPSLPGTRFASQSQSDNFNQYYTDEIDLSQDNGAVYLP